MPLHDVLMTSDTLGDSADKSQSCRWASFGGTTLEFSMGPDRYESCIDACNACADACDYCAAACLHGDDVKMMVACIALDMDCAASCRMAASYMSRDSRFAVDLCRLCGQICEACATECARHPEEHCQACARACRRCAQECARMANE